MKNKVLYTVGILVIIVAAFFVFKNVSLAPSVENNNTENNIEKVKIEPNIPSQTLPLSNDPKDMAWSVFQKYLEFNKNRDLEGVKSVVYKVASVCEDPQTRIDCEGRMGLAYMYGSVFKKENFANVWSDEKQIILSTDFKVEEDDVSIGRTRSIIFFVKNDAGNLVMLSFSPFKGAIVSKDTLASREELDDRLVIYTEDNDKDGISDYDEQCLAFKEGEACIPTSPKLRDTDDNGLWDGVEALMN